MSKMLLIIFYPNEYTILDLAKKIIKLTNSNSKLVYNPLPQDDPLKRKPNITELGIFSAITFISVKLVSPAIFPFTNIT